MDNKNYSFIWNLYIISNKKEGYTNIPIFTIKNYENE